MRLPLIIAAFGAVLASSSFGQLIPQVLVRGYFSSPTLQTSPNLIVTNVLISDFTADTLSYRTGGALPSLRPFSLGADGDKVLFKEASVYNFDFEGTADTEISLGSVRYVNRTPVQNNFAPIVNLNLALNFRDVGLVQLTPITFSLDATGFRNYFGAIVGLEGQVVVAGKDYRYYITGLNPVFVASGNRDNADQFSAVFVRFHPIPEPSTYGVFAAAGLLALVGFRRRAKRRAATSVRA